MARYKHFNYDQLKLLPTPLPPNSPLGTFEHSLSHIIDHELDLSIFDERYPNDDTGAPAYDPCCSKIVLYGHGRGITSSREIEQRCRENVIFVALSADSQPHFTTIAGFISSMHEEIVSLLAEVLLVCDSMGLDPVQFPGQTWVQIPQLFVK